MTGVPAGAGDVANWQAALGAGQSTGDLRAWLAHSGVAAARIQGFYEQALGRGATEAGTSTTTGDGGMTEEERQS